METTQEVAERAGGRRAGAKCPRDRRPTAEETLLWQNAIKASMMLIAVKRRLCDWRLGSALLYAATSFAL
jgi:hypothetical protein